MHGLNLCILRVIIILGMPSKRPQLVNREIYHVFNRGVEKRDIFQVISDYFRFIFCLYELNDKNLVKMRTRIKERKERKCTGRTRANKREPLVEIIAFCLMPNHYHLVLRQLVDKGISLFMKKLGDSYVGYFNQKYNRKGMGSIFQGRFRVVHVATNDQLLNLICYIFTNPLELLEKNWKELWVKNSEEAIKYLESYRWSSYLDYIGKPNFPSVTERDFLIKVFRSPENIKKFVESWVLYKAEVRKGYEKIKGLTFE